MTNYAVGIDYGGAGDQKRLDDIINALKKCSGGTVTSLGIGPSKVQNYGLTSAAKGKTGVYITNGARVAERSVTLILSRTAMRSDTISLLKRQPKNI